MSNKVISRVGGPLAPDRAIVTPIKVPTAAVTPIPAKTAVPRVVKTQPVCTREIVEAPTVKAAGASPPAAAVNAIPVEYNPE